MKKYIYLIILLISFTSCKKFLDVRPESEIDKDQLFSTEGGFKEALNGVYNHCAGPFLYGGYLTFSNLDIMAQNYDFTDVGSQRIANFQYTDEGFTSNNQTIWEYGYRGIANCNNILLAMDAKKALFQGQNYNLIKGEALALRAYLHFDLLRMFAPSYTNKPGAKGIPYVTTVTNTDTRFSTVSEVIEKALADLNEAKTLLSTADPILSSAYIVGYPSNDKATETKNADLFLQNRRHRMNYFSVCAELARVYIYKADYVNSLANAKIVIDSQKFPFTDVNDLAVQDVAKKDRIFYNELLTAWYIPQRKDMLATLFSPVAPQYSGTVDHINEIYEVRQTGGLDWRLKYLFLKVTAQSGGERSVLQKYVVNTTPVANLHPLVAPALRLSEMYYIAAEASYGSNPGAAISYFNTIRMKRGIENNLTATPDRDSFLNLLMAEARKEFYGESQMFFMYKRLNRAVVVSETLKIQPSDNIFVFPIPAIEQETNH